MVCGTYSARADLASPAVVSGVYRVNTIHFPNLLNTYVVASCIICLVIIKNRDAYIYEGV